MGYSKRIKTGHKGVYYREVKRIGHVGTERMYYIIFTRDGKICEEKVGRQYSDGMTSSRAARIRAEKIGKKGFSRKEIREEAEKWREEAEHYRSLFEDAPVSIREVDCTQLMEVFDKLKKQGVRNFRHYFAQHPEFVEQAQKLLKVIDANDAAVKLYEAKNKQDILVSLDKIMMSELLPIFRENINRMAEGKKVFEGEGITQTFQGNRIDILFKVLFPESKGGKTAVVGAINITEQKRAKRALRESEARYRTLYESANDAIIILDIDRGMDCNTKALEIFGCTKEQFLERSYLGFSPERQPNNEFSKKMALEVMNKALAGDPQIFEWQHARYDGTLFDAEVNLKRFNLAGKFFLQAIVRDVTQRKQAELSLRRAFAEIEQLKKQLESDYTYLEDEIRLTYNFEDIIGTSNPLKKVLKDVEKIAPTETTVFIQGETGVGKELIARAIHNAGLRKNRPLVKVDCATLPPNLIESELFGHEKGAFSGAHAKQIGRFELADGSTIFLDEIGELPLELQTKLLRVLQDGEFERLGSPRTCRCNVRVIAATNRNLEAEVKSGRFRKDLWYRINVFPISVPPLRERKQDIPLIANFVMRKFTKKTGKKVNKIPAYTMKELQEYSWPGNVRELENVIERAVIKTEGPLLVLADSLKTSGPAVLTLGQRPSLAEVERKHIIEALDEKNWRIHGTGGAAALLGLNPSTLRSRMKKLNIRRQSTAAEI